MNEDSRRALSASAPAEGARAIFSISWVLGEEFLQREADSFPP